MAQDLYQKIEKVVVNVGVGRRSQEDGFKNKVLPAITEELAQIVGQKPAERPAQKSIAGFKIREGNIVGLKTTLRRKRMKQFVDRLINIVLPRVRDFRGIDAKSVDQGGNLTIGLKDHVVFPEISPELSQAQFGLQITIVPKDRMEREEAIQFYRDLNIPLKKDAK